MKPRCYNCQAKNVIRLGIISFSDFGFIKAWTKLSSRGRTTSVYKSRPVSPPNTSLSLSIFVWGRFRTLSELSKI